MCLFNDVFIWNSVWVIQTKRISKSRIEASVDARSLASQGHTVKRSLKGLRRLNCPWHFFRLLGILCLLAGTLKGQDFEGLSYANLKVWLHLHLYIYIYTKITLKQTVSSAGVQTYSTFSASRKISLSERLARNQHLLFPALHRTRSLSRLFLVSVVKQIQTSLQLPSLPCPAIRVSTSQTLGTSGPSWQSAQFSWTSQTPKLETLTDTDFPQERLLKAPSWPVVDQSWTRRICTCSCPHSS